MVLILVIVGSVVAIVATAVVLVNASLSGLIVGITLLVLVVISVGTFLGFALVVVSTKSVLELYAVVVEIGIILFEALYVIAVVVVLLVVVDFSDVVDGVVLVVVVMVEVLVARV